MKSQKIIDLLTFKPEELREQQFSNLKKYLQDWSNRWWHRRLRPRKRIPRQTIGQLTARSPSVSTVRLPRLRTVSTVQTINEGVIRTNSRPRPVVILLEAASKADKVHEPSFAF